MGEPAPGIDSADPVRDESERARPWIFVPPLGELYSTRSGSSLPSLVAAMAREHTLRGGHSSVIVRRGLAHEARGSRLLAVDMHKVTLSRLERRADVALARVGLRRRCFGRMI
jgi:hypothetical protein